MTHKRHHAIIFYSFVAIVGTFFVIFISQYLPNNAQIGPLNVKDFIQTADNFDALTGLDVTPTYAPAISCSLTNVLHLIATDGSAYTLTNTTPMFSPALASIIPYNGKTLDHVNVDVFLYCSNPPTYTTPYQPYLVGGNVAMTFYSHDSSGYSRLSQPQNTINLSSGPTKISGTSLLLGTFTEPASAINSILGPNFPSTSYSVQNAVTTGTLQFKQQPSQNLIYTYNIKPITTAFSLSGNVISSNPPTQTSTNLSYSQSINVLSSTVTPVANTFDSSKESSAQLQITVQNYMQGKEQAPVYTVTPVFNGQPSPSTVQAQQVSATPTSTSGQNSIWNVNVPISSLNNCGSSQCLFEADLYPQALSNGQQRPPSQTQFSILFPQNGNSQSPSSCIGILCNLQNYTTQTLTTSTTTTNNNPPQCSAAYLAQGWAEVNISPSASAPNWICLPPVQQWLNYAVQYSPYIVILLIFFVVLGEVTKKYRTPRMQDIAYPQ